MAWLIIVYVIGTVVGMMIALRSWRWWLSAKHHYLPRYELCMRHVGDDVRCWHEGGYPYRLPHTWAEIIEILVTHHDGIEEYLIMDRWTRRPVHHHRVIPTRHISHGA